VVKSQDNGYVDTTLIEEHCSAFCSPTITLNCEDIIEFFSSELYSFCNSSVSSFQELVQKLTHQEITYPLASKIRRLTNRKYMLSAEQQSMLLQSYLQSFISSNSTSSFEILLDKDDSLIGVFILMPNATAVVENAIPVISLDATFFKLEYRRVILCATMIDGNKNIHLLALFVCHSENNYSWNYFILKLTIILPSILTTCKIVISDMHQSIINAVSNNFPGCIHRKCLFHIFLRLKHHTGFISGSDQEAKIKYLLQNAAYTDSKQICDNSIQLINNKYPKAGEYLSKFEKKEFCSSYIPFPTFDRVTSQFAESFNNVLTECRKEEILLFCVKFFSNYTKRYEKLRKEMKERGTKKLASFAENHLNKMISNAKKCVCEVRGKIVVVRTGIVINTVKVNFLLKIIIIKTRDQEQLLITIPH
jgi:hypothetical protein